MARIEKIKISSNDDAKRGVIISFDNGETMILSFADAGIIKQQLLLEELRCGIASIVEDEIASGSIDQAKYDNVREDFDTEIYDDLAEDILCGDYSALCHDGEYIREKVTDLAVYYDLEPDE